MNNNIFNFLDTNLNKLDKATHNILKDTFIDGFIHELQDYLKKCNSYELFKQLPPSTYFHLTGYDNNFFECMAYEEKKIYYIPKDSIVGIEPKLGDALTYANKNKLSVNYGGIPLWKDEISEFKSKCSIAE